MTQMWPLCSQKNNTTTTATMKLQHESSTTTTTTTATTIPSTKSPADTTSSSCNCCCVVTKLMRKLKRRSRSTLRSASASRQGSFQCCYDPLSYSLNFDTTGCGSLLDEDYYKFYAFSSRFVASNPRASCPIVQVAAGNSH